MELLLRSKFSQEPLRTWLLDTDPAELVEGNYWHDQFWGNCTCAVHFKFPGENHLGVQLMQIREQLMEGLFWSLGRNTREEVAEHLQ